MTLDSELNHKDVNIPLVYFTAKWSKFFEMKPKHNNETQMCFHLKIIICWLKSNPPWKVPFTYILYVVSVRQLPLAEAPHVSSLARFPAWKLNVQIDNKGRNKGPSENW